MDFEKTATPYGYSIFCEDIRQEVNGKQTYVGIINAADLNIFGSVPAFIGKFCVSATYRQRTSDGLEPVTLEIHMPGDDDDKPTTRVELSIADLVTKLPPAAPDVDDPIMGLGMYFEFNPLEIKREGRIQVSAVKAGKRYRLGSLRILSLPPAPPIAPETKEAAN